MKKVIFTDKAPTPIGPYSQAVQYDNTLYISGQIPMDASVNQLMMNSIEDQTHQVMKNLSYLLEEARMSFSEVVKTTIFITDMNDFSKINEVYGSYFTSGDYPARETVQVSALPRGVNVEISMIAIKK